MSLASTKSRASLGRIREDAVAKKKFVSQGTHSREVLLTTKKWRIQKRREAEPTTQHRNEVGLAVRRAKMVLLAESYRQQSCKPINVSCRSHAEPSQPTMRFPEIFGPLAWA